LGSVSLWRGFPRAVAECTRRRALIYSRLGHGFSDPPSAPRTPDFMHEEARAILPLLLDAWHADAPVLIGHSDGASIALIRAAENPVTALVCLAPHVFVEDTCLDSIRAAKASFDRGALRERMARHHRDVDACFYWWNDVWLHPEFPRRNIEGLLSAIVVPALLIQGAEDRHRLAQIDSVAGRVRGPVERVVLEARHAPHLEAPYDTLVRVARFLDTVG